jgi:outer membrane protein assembly factor BamB
VYRQSAAEDRSLLISAFGNKVLAVDRATGAIRWRATISGMSGPFELAMQDGVVVVCSESVLAFIDYATGQGRRVVNRADAAVATRQTLVIDGDQVFVGGAGAVVCYTLGGDLVWQQGFRGEGSGDVALGLPGNVRQAPPRT